VWVVAEKREEIKKNKNKRGQKGEKDSKKKEGKERKKKETQAESTFDKKYEGKGHTHTK
jgi:hypothetical protein